jgi:hypothetical protein
MWNTVTTAESGWKIQQTLRDQSLELGCTIQDLTPCFGVVEVSSHLLCATATHIGSSTWTYSRDCARSLIPSKTE